MSWPPVLDTSQPSAYLISYVASYVLRNFENIMHVASLVFDIFMFAMVKMLTYSLDLFQHGLLTLQA